MVRHAAILEGPATPIESLNANASANVNDTWVSANQNCSPSLSHWGTSTIMDGNFDKDKSYLFTAATASSVSVPSGQT